MIRNLSILLFLVIVSSCSAAEWKIKDVSDEEKIWRRCHERLDGPENVDKGFCYISQECIDKWYKKEECKRVPLFCAWDDLQCHKKYGLDRKVLAHPSQIL